MLPPVKNQSGNGTCWAFAITVAMEANYLHQGFTFLNDDQLDLSEMHLSWFAYNNPDKYKAFKFTKSTRAWPIDILQEGGSIHEAAALFSRLDGPVADADLPYTTTQVNGKTVDRFPWYKNRVNELEAKATPEDPIVVEVDGNTMKFTNGIYYVPDQDA